MIAQWDCLVRIPGRVLQHHAVSIRVRKGSTMAIPIRIERWHRTVAVCAHPVDGQLPLRCVGKIKYEEIVVRRCATRRVTAFDRKLEVIGVIAVTQHDAVKALVIFKPAQNLETQTVAIESNDLRKVIGRPRHAQVGRSDHAPSTRIILVPAHD